MAGEAFEFVRGALIEAGAGLFATAGGGQFAGQGGAAGEIRVRLDERQLFGPTGAGDLGGEALVQGFYAVRQRRALVEGAFGDPGGMLVDAAKGRDEGGALVRIFLPISSLARESGEKA